MWFMQFVTKYWIEVLFGLIVTIVSARYKKIKAWWKEIKDDKEKKKKEERMGEVKAYVNELRPMLEEIAKQSAEGDETLRAEMDTLAAEVQILKGGLLTIQGESFKAKCRRLMEDMDSGKFISFKTYESLQHDHNAYNALGGNSDGDELYAIFVYRYENQKTENKGEE